MVICSELQNLIFDRKEVNPGAPQFTQDSAWSEAKLLRQKHIYRFWKGGQSA
jgi:hypothetical protein